jgi:hypothetical protein
MANGGKVGRNDRCPCGSGKKFKQCCEGKTARKLGPAGWAAVLALAAAVAVLAVFIFNLTQGRELGAGGGSCPPGQVWSSLHGHCHPLQ